MAKQKDDNEKLKKTQRELADVSLTTCPLEFDTDQLELELSELRVEANASSRQLTSAKSAQRSCDANETPAHV